MEEAGSLRNRISALEDANKAFQSEISVLQRALEIRASELSGEGGPEVPSRLLFAVAKGREEGVALAVQLAERTAALRRAEETAADARDQLAVRAPLLLLPPPARLAHRGGSNLSGKERHHVQRTFLTRRFNPSRRRRCAWRRSRRAARRGSCRRRSR